MATNSTPAEPVYQQRDILTGVVQEAQAILAAHLPPDGPDAKETIGALLGLLDGPRVHAAIGNSRPVSVPTGSDAPAGVRASAGAPRTPAEVFCLAEFLCEEMQARGWKTEDVAARMGTPSGFAMDLLCLDLTMAVQSDGLIIDDEFFAGLGSAIDVSVEFFRNLHQVWLTHPDRRSPFDCPEDIFGATSHRAMIRAV